MLSTKFEVYDADAVEQAKNTVIEITKDTAPMDTVEIFFSDSLETVEKGIRALNSYSSKCWIISALALYSLIYDKELYKQSGLTWQEYSKSARERLELDPRDITEQLSSARFFIKHRDLLIRKGWTPSVPRLSLARAELALELSQNLEATVNHLVNDTQREFKEWYQSFKMLPVTPIVDKHPEIEIGKNTVKINGITAVVVSEQLPPEQRVRIEGYIQDIFQALKAGDIPAIVPVYDENEGRHLITLRGRYRQGK